jgi:hypothetical protein
MERQMHEQTHTIRHGINLMPWQIEASEGLDQPCILVAVMNGNEMQSVSLHISPEPQAEN